jgi:hypothetical protein
MHQRSQRHKHTMDINITSLLDEDLFPFAHSRMEGGDNAGQNTWNAALKGPRPLLSTPEEIQAFKDWTKGFGAWDDEEREAWSDNETQALFLQFIASEVRTNGVDALDEMDWEEYEEGCEARRYSSNLFRADDMQIYFSLSH